SPADEAKRVRTVREAIGKDVSLMLDMNAPYDVEGCIEFARRVEPLDIYWLEEPLHWYLQPADFVRLAAATSIPLAHGERELTRFTVRDFIATGAIRYVQFDSTRAAGFTEGLRVAALAEQHAVMIAPHTAPELHAHLVAALPRCGFGVESHGDAARNPLSHHLLVGGPETRDGFVHLSDKPGFGVEIDWDYASRSLIAERSVSHVRGVRRLRGDRATHRRAMHQPALGHVVVLDRPVLDHAVVPHQHVARAPLVAIHERRLDDVIRQGGDQRLRRVILMDIGRSYHPWN